MGRESGLGTGPEGTPSLTGAPLLNGVLNLSRLFVLVIGGEVVARVLADSGVLRSYVGSSGCYGR